MSREKKKLPPMPEEGKRPFVMLKELKAELMIDFKRYSSGSLGMVYDSVTLTDTKTKEVLGEVAFALGGGIILRNKKTDCDYSLDAKQIFLAFFNSQEVMPTGVK